MGDRRPTNQQPDPRRGQSVANEKPKPFILAKTTDQIPDPLGQLLQRINGAGH